MTQRSESGPGSPILSRRAAASLLGASSRMVEDWERFVGVSFGEVFTMGDLVTLATLSEMLDRARPRLSNYAAGLEAFRRLANARPDLERLDRCTAVIGRDCAEIREGEAPAGESADVLEVPLDPILGMLRDWVFA